MSVQSIGFNSAPPPAIRFRESPGARSATPSPVQDRAVLSQEAKTLAARLEATEKSHKLHLSPEELRELISPPESEPGR